MQNVQKRPVQFRGFVKATLLFVAMMIPSSVFAGQIVTLDGAAGGKRFDGLGSVSGGGATSVLLKDYPEPQRSQILDLLFKPKFGASLSTLYVEVPGDGNSTQGTEPSHMHSRTDENYYRGYEWWIMREAKNRNPAITLDAAAWSAPGWVGNRHFWSQDMCDYYAKWILGLKSAHGLTLDAIGCRNERGVNERFIKMLRKTLNANGLTAVKTHGFDNWGKTKWNWVKDFQTDPELRDAVDVISNHTISEIPATAEVKALSERLGKPIWNTEEHVYLKGFAVEISMVHIINQNYISSGVTKVVTWYLVGSVYENEPYAEAPALLVANTPWSGHYFIRPSLWAMAHYGQFIQLGWQYLDGACANLDGGGSFVTLKSPGAALAGADYSIIAETKGAAAAQTVEFKIAGGLSSGKLCVWRSNAKEQFVRQPDVSPVNGTVTVSLEPNSIYSLSTTTGQQKGGFYEIPTASAFPFPYYENFDHYGDAKSWGYQPHYTADITGVFELFPRPDGNGLCLKQVLTEPAQSWAPEWMPYTIIGDTQWTDYEVSADVLLNADGWAAVMGRISNTGGGYGCNPKGYYLRLYGDGRCELYSSNSRKNGDPGTLLASGNSPGATEQWHNLKIQVSGSNIVGFVDDNQVLSATDDQFKSGNAGLATGAEHNVRNTALFDNLIINTVNGPTPKPTEFAADKHPIYRER
ncbi:MAG: galactosylceramidase [Tepidisphaeraceae bacterium]